MNFLFDVRKYLARGSLLAVIGVAGEFAMAQAPVVQQHALTPGTQWNWDNLQDWSQQAAPSVQLSRLKEHIASLNVTLLEADNGASIVAATGAAHAKESVTDTLDRRYSRTYGQVGVRMSLLAAAEERQRAVSQARGALQTEAAQRRLLQMQSVTETGRMYVRYMRSQQREQMVAQFLRSQQEAAGATRRRVAQGLMFKSEALELESLYEVAQARTAREQEIQRAALSQMAYLTGRSLVPQVVAPLNIPQACVATSADTAAQTEHPLLEITRIALQGAQERSTLSRYGAIEGGVQLNQSISKDWKGNAGHATGVALDISIPWNWRQQKSALAAKLQAEKELAQHEYEQERQKLLLQSETALAQWQMRENAIEPVLQQYKAAQEALRIASLRKDALDGDGLAQLIRAKHRLYERALQYIDTLEARDLAAVEMAYFFERCVLQANKDAADAAVNVLTATAGVDSAVGAHKASTDSKHVAAGPVFPAGTGWYAWFGRDWLNHPEMVAQLPPGTQRLLLSFKEQELLELGQAGKSAQQLKQLGQLAQQRNIRLELLLGEPTWVLPEGRGHLYRLIASLQSLPFHMIHLDLERSQLPEQQQKDWDKHVIALLSEVASQSALPISLTTHYRELMLPGFIENLGKTGVKEVIPMIYSASPATTLAIMRKMPPLPEGMQIAVAQSIEKELSAQESFYSKGKTEAAKVWGEIAQSLYAEITGFNGIIVQSWDEYLDTRR